MACSKTEAALFLSVTCARCRCRLAKVMFRSSAGARSTSARKGSVASPKRLSASKICKMYRLAWREPGLAPFHALAACKAASPERDCKAKSTALWYSRTSLILLAASSSKENAAPGLLWRALSSPSNTS